MDQTAINPATHRPSGGLGRRMRRVVVVASSAGLLAGALVILAAGQPPGWWQAWFGAAATLLISMLATLPLLALALNKVNAACGTVDARAEATQAAAPIVIAAGVARIVVFAAGAVLLIELLKLPKWPTFSFIAGLYVILASAEVAYVGMTFWRRDSAGETRPPVQSARPFVRS